jgi:glycosyltransferase involved in cell wall biosynthesis
MKFSVLLPTRNRLEYLRYAVETVRRQDYNDWEIIISDNCSDDDVESYITTLADKRIKYFRTHRLIPVTDNWNNALAHSTGDYVTMLGDDDGLLPGYFSRLRKAFENFTTPDFIYLGAYFFAYKGAVPTDPDGFLRLDKNRYFTSDRAHWLTAATAHTIANGYLNFRMPVASNMQFSVISRRMIEELSVDGPFFRSPFPDFYATPLLFLRSKKILVYPAPMVVVGITPKSYGAFHFTDRTSAGEAMLHNKEPLSDHAAVKSVMLPGTSYNDSWLLAMQALSLQRGHETPIFPNYRRYRFLQIINRYKGRYYDKKISVEDLKLLQARLRTTERLLCDLSLPIFFRALRLIPSKSRSRIIMLLRKAFGQHAIAEAASAEPRYSNLLEVYESLDAKSVLNPNVT